MATILQPHRENVRLVAELLRAGEVVGLPTETVYGLAADATQAGAVEKIFAAKERPPTNPLIVHVAEPSMANAFAVTDSPRWKPLVERFWPGPLTLVVPARPGKLAQEVSAGLDSVAIRLPAKALAREVIAAAGCPLAAPSANPSGYTSPTTAAHVAASLGSRIQYILDGGPCERGLESTILSLLDADSPRILRPGPITHAMLVELLGPCVTASPTQGKEETAQRAPGQFTAHYQPRTALFLCHKLSQLVGGDYRNAALIVHAPAEALARAHFGRTIILGNGDPAAAEREFYATLRELDNSGYDSIYFHVSREHPLSEGLMDRLCRASSGWVGT